MKRRDLLSCSAASLWFLSGCTSTDSTPNENEPSNRPASTEPTNSDGTSDRDSDEDEASDTDSTNAPTNDSTDDAHDFEEDGVEPDQGHIDAIGATERHDVSFDRTVHVVDHFGVEPYGGDPINKIIKRLPDRTLLKFPRGRFRIDPGLHLEEISTIGFLGSEDGTTLYVPRRAKNRIIEILDAESVTFENFVIDQNRPDTVGSFRFWVSDRLHIENIVFEGRGLRMDGVEPSAFDLRILEPDGLGIVKGWVDQTGSGWASYNDSQGRIGALVRGARHQGTIKFIECDLREFGNNALYASRCVGNVQVEDCYFENNNVASVRIGGEGSYVEGSTIVVSEDRYTGPRIHEDSSFFMRGIVIEENHSDHGQKAAGAEIRNCELLIEDNPTAAPAIMGWSNGRSVKIEDTTIEYHNDGEGVIVREDYSSKSSHPPGDPPRWLRLENVEISGTGTVPVAVSVEDADGTAIRNSSIHMEGEEVDGVLIVNSEESLIEETTIIVRGKPTTFIDSSVETEALTVGRPDPTPDEDDARSPLGDGPPQNEST